MVSEVQQKRLRRLKEKHTDGMLRWGLKNGFEISPRESDLVLETAKGILLEGKMLERGKYRVVGVVFGESAGNTIEEVKKREVVMLLDGGIKDIEYESDADKYPYVQCDSYGRLKGVLMKESCSVQKIWRGCMESLCGH